MNGAKKGTLTLIYGPMFAGKSEETQRLIRRYMIVPKNIAVFKWANDDRDECDECKTHAGNIIKNVVLIENPAEILRYLDAVDIAVIEELQFFGEEIVDIVLYIINELGIDVIANGLLSDRDAKPFGYLGDLIPHADTIKSFTAVCTICGADAIYTQAKDKKIAQNFLQIHIGSEDEYEPRCRKCYEFGEEFKDRMKKIKRLYNKVKNNGKPKQVCIIT